MNTQTVTVNLVPGASAPAVVNVSQGDIGRSLAFKIVDGSSPASFGAGTTATIVGTKKSGLGFSVSGTLSGNVVTVETTEAMTEESGKIAAEIRFEQGSTDVGTANFILAVEATPHADGTTDGTSETMASLETRLQAEIDLKVNAPLDDGDVDNGTSGQVLITNGDGSTSWGTIATSLTTALKTALLQIAEKVAYIDEDGQDYYDDLYDALYPSVSSITATYTQSGTVYESDSLSDLISDLVVTVVYTDGTTGTLSSSDYTLSGTLSSGTSTITVTYGNKTATFSVAVTADSVTSITATYTQSGTVYDTDSLSDLTSDLVVTATYTSGNTATISSDDYTLSGTLTTGTSTITVSYGGQTDTFSVTVSVDDGALYSWDFTSSLVDSKNGVTATLNGGATRDSDGVTFSSTSDYIYLANMSAYNTGQFTVEIDFGTFVGSSSANVSYPCALATGTGFSNKAGVFKYNNWGIKAANNTNTYTSISDVNYFANKTLKFVSDISGNQQWHLYADGTLLLTASAYSTLNNRVYLGIAGLEATTVVKAVRVYEGVI